MLHLSYLSTSKSGHQFVYLTTTGIRIILQKSSYNQGIPRTLWNHKFQDPNSYDISA